MQGTQSERKQTMVFIMLGCSKGPMTDSTREGKGMKRTVRASTVTSQLHEGERVWHKFHFLFIYSKKKERKERKNEKKKKKQNSRIESHSATGQEKERGKGGKACQNALIAHQS